MKQRFASFSGIVGFQAFSGSCRARHEFNHAESWIMPINVWQAPFASVFSRISWKHSSA
jgi:hypothetical protein